MCTCHFWQVTSLVWNTNTMLCLLNHSRPSLSSSRLLSHVRTLLYSLAVNREPHRTGLCARRTHAPSDENSADLSTSLRGWKTRFHRGVRRKHEATETDCALIAQAPRVAYSAFRLSAFAISKQTGASRFESTMTVSLVAGYVRISVQMPSLDPPCPQRNSVSGIPGP